MKSLFPAVDLNNSKSSYDYMLPVLCP